MDQEKFGKILGVGNKAVSAWETGRQDIPAGKMLLLDKNYGISMAFLETGKGDIFSQESVDVSNNPQESRDNALQYLAEQFQRLPEELQRDVMDFMDRLKVGGIDNAINNRPIRVQKIENHIAGGDVNQTFTNGDIENK